MARLNVLFSLLCMALGAGAGAHAQETGVAFTKRDINNPQYGDAVKAIPAPKLTSKCTKRCVYVTAPQGAPFAAEFPITNNLTVDDMTQAFQMDFGQSNTIALQYGDNSITALTFAWERSSSYIIFSQGGNPGPHTLLARWSTATKTWVGSKTDAPYDYTMSNSTYDGNLYILFK